MRLRERQILIQSEKGVYRFEDEALAAKHGKHAPDDAAVRAMSLSVRAMRNFSSDGAVASSKLH
jgi:hypothetical protein